MIIRTVKFERLASDEIAVWSNIQRSEPMLASPYFRPEFTQAVAAVRSNVEVAVLEDQGRPVGFFPFQRSRWNVGGPVGSTLSDFQALIAPSSITCDPTELLRACALKAWQFDHLLSEQSHFSQFISREDDSPFIELANGLDRYVAEKTNGRHIMSKIGQKMRKLAREVGPIRFEADTPDRNMISTLLAWKSEQFRRQRLPNVFDLDWARNLLDTIADYRGEDFSSMTSVMYAGDTVAAINFSMRSGGVLHPWFTAYNVDLRKYSPGYVHWIETLKAAGPLGIRRIDFGKGPESYKRRLMTGAAKVAEGTVDLRPSSAIFRRALHATGEHIRKSPLAKPARVTARIARRFRHWLDVQSAVLR